MDSFSLRGDVGEIRGLWGSLWKPMAGLSGPDAVNLDKPRPEGARR